MIEPTDRANLHAEVIAANVFLDHFGTLINREMQSDVCSAFRTQIFQVESNPDFQEQTRLLQGITTALDYHRKKLTLEDKQIYYLQLNTCLKNEEAKWKKNAFIIALFCTIFFAGWIYLNTLLFLYLPPAFFLLGFQIILTLNLLLFKGLQTATAHKDSLETELFYNHVTIYKEITLALKEISLQYYNPAANLDEKIKRNTHRLLEIIADLIKPQNPTEVLNMGQHVFDHKRLLAQIFVAIFHDPDNAGYLWIFNNPILRFALAQILNRISLEDEDKVKEQENKTYLLAILQNFAQATGHRLEYLQTLFTEKRWYELFDILLLKD